jgi:DNA-binding beta-propeller fold protein YncE
MMGRSASLKFLLSSLLLVVGAAPSTATNRSPYADQFTLFESGQVRPMALSADGRFLYVVNTPDNRLEIFRVNNGHHPQGPLTWLSAVRVGLEPVAVAARSAQQVWVVNHLSDSVSVVNVATPRQPVVERTLLVGDEPRDIVFAGPQRRRAFITTAHRGQNNPNDPQLTTPGVGRADVWVFDSHALGNSLGGSPLNIITLFADTPRALAVSPDGSKVYAAAFHSGNRTATIQGQYVTDGGPAAPDGLGLAAPVTNFQGIPQPEESVIVKYDGSHWRDQATNRNWDDRIKFNLPDKDVFTINANANPPTALSSGTFAGVGTILFNMVVNPVSGKVYVSNTEARNEFRFEGAGDFFDETVRGRLHQSRITVLAGSTAQPRHLNKHIDYNACCAPLPNAENDRSLAQPVDMAITNDGRTLFVSAFGSAKIGIFDTAELEADSFVPDDADHIELSGGGPTGLVLDQDNGRLYVLTRFDNTVTAIDVASRSEVARRALFNPEPAEVKTGRSLLYDARKTSSNGEASCASCHVFSDLDSLAWNLGNPDGTIIPNPGPFTDPQTLIPGVENFHPMKGPMATQSLRGMANHGPMHWRGDRNGNNETGGISAQPDTGLFDERQAFREFNPAFEGLLGGPSQLSSSEMDALTDFALELTYPPNPIRNLDNSLTASQARGRDHFFQPDVAALNPILPSPLTSCNGCHQLDPVANAEFGVKKPGFFGTNGIGVVDTGGLQHVKTPHLRNLYQKVGMFGLGPTFFLPPDGDYSHKGDQIRGYGFTHDGGVDTIFRFISSAAFADFVVPGGFAFDVSGDPGRRDLESYLLAFDSNMAPIVGQQVTLDRHSSADRHARADLLLARAGHAPAECEVVASTVVAGQQLSFLYLAGSDRFVANEHALPPLPESVVRLTSYLAPLTYTCVPVGSGQRIGLDSDLDGCYDATETRRGFDPRNAVSRPPGCS